MEGAPKSWRGRFAVEPKADATVSLHNSLPSPSAPGSQTSAHGLAAVRAAARVIASAPARVAEVSGITALRAQRKSDRAAAVLEAEAQARRDLWRKVTNGARDNARGVLLSR
jgi:hypothetical protein